MSGAARTALTHLEELIDASGQAPVIEELLPRGVRTRQLTVRTLLIGMHLALADGRPAHLTRVLAALTGLPAADKRRLGVIVQWKKGPHELDYRQVEHTWFRVVGALRKRTPDGAPCPLLQEICDRLLEASIPAELKNASTSLAGDWTDQESWSRPPPHGATVRTDPEAAWGHRNTTYPGPKGELFYGRYLSMLTMVGDDNGPPPPELVRRMTVASCALDPAVALAGVLTALPGQGVPLGDVLVDSGYSYRVADSWAIPVRRAGGHLVCDLHPNDRGPQGTCHGAIICNGCLYCPQTPTALLGLVALPPAASLEEMAAHDRQTTELARYKLGRHSGDDADGYHRVACPATTGKIRCPLRPASMTLQRDRPEILTPPEQPPACCTQQTITVTPDVAAKTAQKHDYPSRVWRRSYQRRTAAERSNASVKDPATTTIARGWLRLTGVVPAMLWTACLIDVRNQRILAAFHERQDDNARRAAAGLPPRTRRRRRRAEGATHPANRAVTAVPAPP